MIGDWVLDISASTMEVICMCQVQLFWDEVLWAVLEKGAHLEHIQKYSTSQYSAQDWYGVTRPGRFQFDLWPCWTCGILQPFLRFWKSLKLGAGTARKDPLQTTRSATSTYCDTRWRDWARFAWRRGCKSSCSSQNLILWAGSSSRVLETYPETSRWRSAVLPFRRVPPGVRDLVLANQIIYVLSFRQQSAFVTFQHIYAILPFDFNDPEATSILRVVTFAYFCCLPNLDLIPSFSFTSPPFPPLKSRIPQPCSLRWPCQARRAPKLAKPWRPSPGQQTSQRRSRRRPCRHLVTWLTPCFAFKTIHTLITLISSWYETYQTPAVSQNR